MNEVSIYGIAVEQEVSLGEDLARLLTTGLRDLGMRWRGGDILVVAQKIVSKAEGRVVRLTDVTPSVKARRWARLHGKDPRVVEVVLGEARRIVRMERGVLIAQTRQGYVCANCGVDASNTEPGTVVLLPEDPDASARRLSRQIAETSGAQVACLISDTFGRPWRRGQVNVALGVAGMSPLQDLRGDRDRLGNVLRATISAPADELAAAAGLVMLKSNATPAALIRGFGHDAGEGSGADLIRSSKRDLFR